MIINNPDALKGWLSVILEPLCDADPAALARYVFALLKKDRPIKELKKTMADQLDVFLGGETRSFLDRLFAAIASEEYLTQQATPATEAVSNSNTNNEPLVKHDKECTPPLVHIREVAAAPIPPPAEIQNPPPAPQISKEFKIDANNSLPVEEIPNPVVALTVGNVPSVSPAKAASDKENQPRESRRRRPSIRSRSRSRSRSFDRARRSRSRDRKISEREKNSRQFRNKSPPIERRRAERRALERSPRSFGKTRTKSHSASRSRSGSPERRKISRSSSPSPNELGLKRQRCRDFDQKGYCVRGETCPWDHGVNPVVLEDLNNPTLLSMQPHLREYNPDAPELWNRSGTFPGPRPGFPGHKNVAIPGSYPRPPGIGFRPAGPPFPFPVNPAATTPLQRELISVPVVDASIGGDVSAVQAKRRYEPEDTVAVAEGPTKRKLPINSRLGPRITPQQNCSLELRKIPRGMNTIAHLNNHFSKFGKIVNIQISYDGDPEAAIVTFSTHAEANVAYRSTEAVLNNRFIKVFWHSPGNSGEPSIANAPPTKEDTIVNGRKQSQYHLNNIPAVPTPAAEGAKTVVSLPPNIATATTQAQTTASTANTTATTVVPSPAALRIKNNRPTNAIIRKKQEEQVKAAVQLAHGLHKRKHELLQKYLTQMRSAVELVERVDHADPQRPKMLETINELQGSIDKLRKEISSEQAQIAAQIQNQPPAKKSKEQQKKELLDIELELIAQQQEGNDTSAIQKRLEELQRSLGTTSKPHFNKRNTRIRSGPPGTTSVDRRPTALLITGFAKEDSDLVVAHFKHVGEITKHDLDKNIPQLTIVYATRSNAEQAVIRGRSFPDKRLQIAWAPQVNQSLQPQLQQQQQQNQQQPQQKSDIVSSETAGDNKADPLPELRLEDEEEEEDGESEDRSWRR